MSEKPAVKIPSTPAECADLLYKTRTARLLLQAKVDAMKDVEGALCEYFIENLPRSNASGIAGKLARVQIEPKPVPQVSDWLKFYAYVKKNNAFDLLQRRLSEGAVKERLDNKVKLPGVTIFNAKKVSCTKLK